MQAEPEAGAFSILVVEDEILVAMEIEFTLRRQGFRVAGVANTHPRALAIAARERPDLALVDIRLADGHTGPEIVRDLAAMGVPAVFCSGNCPGAGGPALGCLHKPFSESGLLGAVRAAQALMAGRAPDWAPSGFIIYGEAAAPAPPDSGPAPPAMEPLTRPGSPPSARCPR